MIKTQISQALERIDQITFEKMMTSVTMIDKNLPCFVKGTMAGKSKTTAGTPDAFFLLPNGNYIYQQCTTQNKKDSVEKFLTKLEEDIANCFDSAKTGIDGARIEQIILPFTTEIDEKEIDRLKAKLKTYSSTCTMLPLGINSISDKAVEFPYIAANFLSVPYCTNQIFSLNQYIIRSAKGMHPPLTNEFRFREKEMEDLNSLLNAKEIILLTGKAGVGKTKLACNFLDTYKSKNPEYKVYVIKSYGTQSIHADLSRFLMPTQKYILLFDDANLADNCFLEVLNFIQNRTGETIKLIITAREYASEPVRNNLDKMCMSYQKLALSYFNNKQIIEIAEAELEPGKHLVDVAKKIIVDIAKGNARLAMMAGQVARTKKTLGSLYNATELYEDYFKPVLSEMKFLKEGRNFEVLALLGFFGTLHKNNTKAFDIIEKNFNISSNGFWSALKVLNNYELVDIHEDQAAKVADQVLSTYAFYYVFVREGTKSLPLEKLVIDALLSNQSRSFYSIADIHNTFNSESTRKTIQYSLRIVEKNFASDVDLLYAFYNNFWYYFPTSTLNYIDDRIKEIKQDSKTEFVYTFQPNTFIGRNDKILELIRLFFSKPGDYLKTALELSFKYVAKQPATMPYFVDLLGKDLVYVQMDYSSGYARQNYLFDFLIASGSKGKEKTIKEQIFLHIAELYLKTFYQGYSGTGEKLQVSWVQFWLVNNDSLIALRKKIISKIFSLYNANRKKGNQLLNFYATDHQNFHQELWALELPLFSDFIKKNFKGTDYAQSIFTYSYVELLDEKKVSYPVSFKKIYDNPQFKLALILSTNRKDFGALDLDDLKKKKIAALKVFFKDYTLEDYKKCLAYLPDVISAENGHSIFWITDALTQLFINILKENKKLFYPLLEHYLKLGAKLQIREGQILYAALVEEKESPKQIFKIISKHNYDGKFAWMKAFFELMLSTDVNKEYLTQLIKLYEKFPVNGYQFNFISLHKFDMEFQKYRKNVASWKKSKNLVVHLTKLILNKSDNNYSRLGDNVISGSAEYYQQDKKVAEKVFAHMKRTGQHFDLDCSELKLLMEWNPAFLENYFKEESKNTTFLPVSLDHLRLNFVWDLKTYKDVIKNCLDILAKKDPIFSNTECKATQFFKDLNEEPKKQKALELLREYIKKNRKSKAHLTLAMNIVTYCFSEQIVNFFIEIIKVNKSLGLASSLWLHPNKIMTSDRASDIDDEIKLYEEVVAGITAQSKSTQYLKHIQRLNERIDGLKKQKKNEDLHNFLED